VSRHIWFGLIACWLTGNVSQDSNVLCGSQGSPRGKSTDPGIVVIFILSIIATPERFN